MITNLIFVTVATTYVLHTCTRNYHYNVSNIHFMACRAVLMISYIVKEFASFWGGLGQLMVVEYK